MADKRISELPLATTPLAGTEEQEIIQGGVNKRVAVSEVGGGGGAVDSVNGQTGAVVLDAGDVGADPAGSASTVATNLSNHISDSSAAHAASAISFSATGNISSTDAQAAIVELDTKTANGKAAATTTGVAISFATPQFYASAGTPATGNITLVTTGLVPGMVQVLYHDDSTIPTFASDFVRISGFYITDTLNIIYMHAITTTRIEYMIFQEL